MSPTNRVVIVGAGISGLALAYRLRQADPGCEITILEKTSRPGGTVWTEDTSGFRVEFGANGFLDHKSSTLQLCRDLGLEDRLIAAEEAASRNRYLFLGDRLKPLPGSLPALLRTDLLSWRGKLNLFAERFRRPRRSGGDESVDAFARRRAGPEVAEIFADALVTGIHAGDPQLLSMSAAFPRIASLEREFGSVIKGLGRSSRRDAGGAPGRMWSFGEGLRLLIDSLGRVLSSSLQFGASAERLAIQTADAGRSRWTVYGADRLWEADAVVLACPAYQQAAVLASVDQALADEVGAVAYNRVAVVAVGYGRNQVPINIDGFGYISPQRTRRDVLGVQWCSSIFPSRAPDGSVLLRAMCGGWHRPEVVGWDDDRLLHAVRSDLAAAMRITAEPCFHRIIRWDRAIPQYLLGHGTRVARIDAKAARHPGLFLAGNAYHGVALNDCTEQAAVLAQRVQRYLADRGR
jgi:oxygen-dependent protoporphyrinogen oxidase